tara:strand:+ start:159 stop:416 length:258 start_codon:yes stop_codon:yes gene_type:complete
MQIRGYDKNWNVNYRNYKLTPKNRSYGTTWKVEVWNRYGMKRTVYERNIMDASKVIYDYWENEDKEYDKMKVQQRCINKLVKKEK